MSENNQEHVYLVQNAKLTGHSGHVTKIAVNWNHPEILVTASRDKTLIVWHVINDFDSRNIGHFKFAQQKKSLVGHGHYVSDVVITSDAKYALSASYDRTLRLWDVETGKCTRKFISHTNDVTCVAVSTDHRFIISGSRDRTIKIWNTLGECKATLGQDKSEGHTDWISSVKYANYKDKQAIVSYGMDSKIKIWDLASCNLVATRKTDTGPILSGSITPDYTLTAAGGKNGKVTMFETEDLIDSSIEPLVFTDNEAIVAVSFSPQQFWVAAAHTNNVKLYDLETKEVLQVLQVLEDLTDEEAETKTPRILKPTALNFSSDGATLFAAYDDNSIRVWDVIDPL